MRVFIPALAGLGLALFTSGLPPLNPARLAARVDPYLNGLGGRPSSLLAASQGRAHRRRPPHVLGRLLPSEAPDIRARLLAAGQSQTPDSFRFDQFVWAAAGASIALGLVVLGTLLEQGPDPRSMLALVPLAAATGWAGRDRLLSRAVARRRGLVRQELPVALDLMTLSIIAGEAVPQAMARVGAMLGGEVGREFARVLGSIRAGSTATEALRELPSHLPDSGVGRLVDALCTGIERGAPLAEALRAQADDLRQAVRRDLLESAGRREILMLLPIVFLILPTIVAFTLLPGLVSLDLLVA